MRFNSAPTGLHDGEGPPDPYLISSGEESADQQRQPPVGSGPLVLGSGDPNRLLRVNMSYVYFCSVLPQR